MTRNWKNRSPSQQIRALNEQLIGVFKPRFAYENQWAEPTTDYIGLIALTESVRQSVAGKLLGAAESYPAPGTPDFDFTTLTINTDVQTGFYWVGTQLAGIAPFALAGLTPAGDGLIHLAVTIDPNNPTNYTISPA